MVIGISNLEFIWDLVPRFAGLMLGIWERGETMRICLGIFMAVGIFLFPGIPYAQTQETTPAQKRILIERGEKVSGQRLELVKKVIESYKDCEVLSQGDELVGLRINGKLYSDFTLVVRDAKRTIIVATPDGVVSFDY